MCAIIYHGINARWIASERTEIFIIGHYNCKLLTTRADGSQTVMISNRVLFYLCRQVVNWVQTSCLKARGTSFTYHMYSGLHHGKDTVWITMQTFTS